MGNECQNEKMKNLVLWKLQLTFYYLFNDIKALEAYHTEDQIFESYLHQSLMFSEKYFKQCIHSLRFLECGLCKKNGT